jgi:GR25 family glycosyltransferase involved in LPS biosynthesis
VTPYRGVFINLPENERRRNGLLSNLSAAGIGSWYTHFPAIDGRAEAANVPTKLAPGALGLWLTHEKIVEQFADGTEHLHILEDDAVVAREAKSLLPMGLRNADQHLGDWDLIFTETFVPFELFETYRKMMQTFDAKRRFSYLDLTSCYASGMSSFFLNRKSIEKYAGLIKDKWSTGIPIDLHVRRLLRAKELRAFVTVPFLTSISAESNESGIRGQLDASRQVCDVFRRGFFVDADVNGLVDEMRRLTEGTAVSPLTQLYLSGYAFACSDRYVDF